MFTSRSVAERNWTAAIYEVAASYPRLRLSGWIDWARTRNQAMATLIDSTGAAGHVFADRKLARAEMAARLRSAAEAMTSR